MPSCKSCHAAITFAKTSRGIWIPLDSAPVEAPRGNIAVVGGIAVFVPKDKIDDFRAAGGKLFESHFATCPNRKKHRKVKPVAGADASKDDVPF